MFPARYDCQTLSKGDALGNIIGNGIFLYAKGISKLTVQPFLRLAEIAFISGSIMLFVLYTDFVAVMQMRKSRRQKRRMRIISSGRCRAVIRWS